MARTTEEFIKQAREVYGDKYDYSKVDYKNSKTKVCIICPEHGEFWQTPNQFLKGAGCKLCNRRMYDLKTFIDISNKVHNNRYDYSKVSYIDNYTKVCIICPIHGDFWQTPYEHAISKHGCCKCKGYNKKRYNKLTTETFIQFAKEIHGDKYDYSKVEYKGYNTDVIIGCPIHGDFLQKPKYHLSNHKCPQCSPRSKLTTEEFIERARKIHGSKYDYSKVEYKNNTEKVRIICPIHGEFLVSPASFLLRKTGCPICGHDNTSDKIRLGLDAFVEQARKLHGGKYDYSKVEYKNNHTKVCIICPEHGEFWQTPNCHLRKYSCPICRDSRLEKEIRNLLISKGITFISQKKFDWLQYKSNLSLDFYLPDYNIAIECQGRQHFESVEHFGGHDALEQIKHRDKKKKQLCEAHGIKMLYFASKKYNEEIIIDEDSLIEKIKSCKSY